MIGLALALRDALQEAAGRRVVLACVVAGALLSLAFSPHVLALASAAAFLLSELTDWAVYDRLRRRGMALAVALSIGAALASLLLVRGGLLGSARILREAGLTRRGRTMCSSIIISMVVLVAASILVGGDLAYLLFYSVVALAFNAVRRATPHSQLATIPAGRTDVALRTRTRNVA